MNIIQFNEQEFEQILDISEESGVDIEQQLQSSFESLLFLGGNINDPDLLDVAIFNIRLCYVYFKRKEDYAKLAEIIKLTHLMDNNSKKQRVVDTNVIDDIKVNLN